MSLTLTDLFCGAGGSSTGALGAGIRVRMAANHWRLACDIHNANHPDADHATVDLHEEDPRYFPRTDVLWASPECTRWSKANGGKPLPAIEEGLFEDPLSNEAAQRSRLLMFDVLKFAEFHRYRAMVIENVVDIATRPRYRLAWKAWQADLRNLGYGYRVVSLNSMHAQALGPPAPQSRDRVYIVCWRQGGRAPDVDRYMRPRAWCVSCEMAIESRQAWKPGRAVGCYRQQYVYIHPACGTQVEPAWLPAAAAIDWSIPGTRIGDRPVKDFYDRSGNYLGRGHLAPKTRARIAAGIARYWRSNTRTVITAVPPLHISLMGGGDTHLANSARPVSYELRTLTAEGNNDYLLTPYYSSAGTARPVTDPLGTLTTHDRYGLVTPAGGTWNDTATSTDEALRTLTTRDAYALVTRRDIEAQVDDCLFRMLQPHEIAAGMAFPADYDWAVRDSKGRLPSNRDLVKMAGNAVTPPAARDLLAAVAESLGAEVAS